MGVYTRIFLFGSALYTYCETLIINRNNIASTRIPDRQGF